LLDKRGGNDLLQFAIFVLDMLCEGGLNGPVKMPRNVSSSDIFTPNLGNCSITPLQR